MTFQAGLGRNTRFLGWGVGFLDFDNDGWADILVMQWPRLSGGRLKPRSSPATGERKVLYKNLGNGSSPTSRWTQVRA